MFHARRYSCSLLIALTVALMAFAEDEPKPVDNQSQLNDKLGKGIETEKNACVLLWKAFGPKPEGYRTPLECFKRLGIEEPPERGDYFVGISKFVTEHLQLDPVEYDGVFDQLGSTNRRTWTAADYPFINAWLKVNEKPLAVMIQASKRTQFYSPLLSAYHGKERDPLFDTCTPIVNRWRIAAQALCSRAMLRMGEGKPDEAWSDLMACLRLARLVSRGGSFREALVGYATEQLASTAMLAYLDRADLTSKQILEKLDEVRKVASRSGVAEKLDLAERAAIHDALDRLRRGQVGIFNQFEPNPVPLTVEDLKQLDSVDWGQLVRSGAAQFDRMVVAMRIPDRSRRVDALNSLEGEYRGLRRAAREKESGTDRRLLLAYLGTLSSCATMWNNSHDRTEQIHTNLQLAFALAAYKRDRRVYPAKLDDLAPKYLPSVPHDIFSGKALIYQLADTGYRLHSVGVNGKDDDGHEHNDRPTGDDIGFAMPIPPQLKP